MCYKSFEDIKFELIEDLKKDPNEVLNIKMLRKEDLIGFHNSLGRWIRNNYKLWDSENPLTQNYLLFPNKHPDVISQNLITEVWEYFNK